MQYFIFDECYSSSSSDSSVINLALFFAARSSEEAIPHYSRKLQEHVQPDMITLGSLSLQQVSATKRKYLCHHPIFTGISAVSIMSCIPGFL